MGLVYDRHNRWRDLDCYRNKTSLSRHVVCRSGSASSRRRSSDYFLSLLVCSDAACPAAFESCCGIVGCLLPPLAMIVLLGKAAPNRRRDHCRTAAYSESLSLAIFVRVTESKTPFSEGSGLVLKYKIGAGPSSDCRQASRDDPSLRAADGAKAVLCRTGGALWSSTGHS